MEGHPKWKASGAIKLMINWLLMLLTGRRKSVREIPSIQVSRMARKWQAAGEWEPTHGRERREMPEWVMRGMQNDLAGYMVRITTEDINER